MGKAIHCCEAGMQRKMKLIRKLLEYLEMSQTEEFLPVPEIDGYTEAQVHYHIGLCQQAGYLLAIDPPSVINLRRYGGITSLTWEGQEALDRMRGGQQGH